MSISAPGIGSGIDIEGLVTQLLAAEAKPAQARLNQREARLQSRLSAFGQFRSALEQLRTSLASLKDAGKFTVRTAKSADESLLTATATADAAPGTYAIEVLRLAASHRLASAPVATATTAVGTGTLTINVGGAAFSVAIDSGAPTLADIRNAINGAPDNSGVTATLVTANDGARLVLTARATGAANTLTVTASGGDGGLAALAYDPGNGIANLTELQAAADAQVSIDGFLRDSPDNQVSDAVTGISLRLLKASPGVPTTLTVADDGAASTKLVTGFVTAYNAVIKTLRDLSNYNATSKTAGPLLGDPTLRGFIASVRNEVVRSIDAQGGFGALFEVGISTAVDGSLTVDTARLDAAMAEDYGAVATLFTGPETGVAQRVDTLLAGFLGDEGVLEARTDGIQAGIRDIGTAREALDRRLEQVEQRLRTQFTALDTLVAQFRNTGDFLTRQLDALLY